MHHKATLNQVPEELKIEDKTVRQRVAKKVLAADPDTHASAPPLWAQQMMAMPYMFPPWAMNFNPMMSAAGPSTTMNPAQIPVTNFSSGLAATGLPSPHGQKRSAAPNTTDIQTWLSEIDTDPIRGRHNVNYGQYGLVLMDKGIVDVSDLAMLPPEKLEEFTGMNFGTANRILVYAKDDVDADADGSKRPRLE